MLYGASDDPESDPVIMGMLKRRNHNRNEERARNASTAAGFVLANGSMSSGQSGEGDIRKNLVESELVDCMVALPGQLFYSTPIPACLWFLARRRKRSGEVLFIDARNLGTMVDRTHRELTSDDITRIAGTYHAWRSHAPPDPRELPSRSLSSRPSTPENPSPLEGEGRVRVQTGIIRATCKTPIRRRGWLTDFDSWQFLALIRHRGACGASPRSQFGDDEASWSVNGRTSPVHPRRESAAPVNWMESGRFQASSRTNCATVSARMPNIRWHKTLA